MTDPTPTPPEDLNRFLPEDSTTPDQLSIEIPADSNPYVPEQLPSGFDPMGEIELRGRAYRGLAAGQMPWWILIAGWVIFGFFAAILLHAAITSPSLTLWILLVFMLLVLLILGRGTLAKLQNQSRDE